MVKENDLCPKCGIEKLKKDPDNPTGFLVCPECNCYFEVKKSWKETVINK